MCSLWSENCRSDLIYDGSLFSNFLKEKWLLFSPEGRMKLFGWVKNETSAVFWTNIISFGCLLSKKSFFSVLGQKTFFVPPFVWRKTSFRSPERKDRFSHSTLEDYFKMLPKNTKVMPSHSSVPLEIRHWITNKSNGIKNHLRSNFVEFYLTSHEFWNRWW